MKKIYLLALSFLTIGAFAQKNASLERIYPKVVKTNYKTPTDTLWGTSVFAGPALYSAQGGGYVVGNNGYGDFQKAQQFLALNNLNVEGAAIWFGGKKCLSGSSTSKVIAWLSDMSGSGTASFGTTAAPGAALQTVDITCANIDTAGNLNFVTFSPYYVASGNEFSVGVDFRNLAAGDTAGIVSSTDGTVDFQDFSWEQWNDNSWHTMLEAWPLDIDFAIFPIIDANPQSINELAGLNGIKFTTFPNPSIENVTVTYAFDNDASKVSIEIYSLNGKLVKSINKGDLKAGNYNETLAVNDLSSGTYFVAVAANGTKVLQKLIIK
jgi:hypothetical protein